MDSRLRFRVFASARGNVFMVEIAELIAAGLRDLGFEPELVRTGLPEPAPGTVNLVVAPHEYFHLLEEYPESQRLDAAADCVPVNVEQPGTHWFEIAYRYCRRAPHVLDINRSGLLVLQRRGLRATHLRLGYHPSWDLWGGGDDGTRDIDLVFLGSRTPHRERFLTANAGTWASLSCRFHVYEAVQPVVRPGPYFAVGEERSRLLGRAKMLLNVHQSEVPYFEWHRVLPSIANGCLVVTEPSMHYEPLRPFEHFVQAPLDALPAYVASLAADHELRQRLARQAYDFVRGELALARLMREVMPVLEDVGGRAAGRRRRTAPAAAMSKDPSLAAEVPALDSGEDAGPSSRLARTLARPPLATLEGQGTPPEVPALFKMVLLNQQAMRRRLDALRTQLLHGEADTHEILATPAFDRVTPDVSVVVTVYNYEQYVTDCLESVLASNGVLPEILVVEDHSLDGSRDRIRDFIASYPHFPVAAFFGRANRGVAEARNMGFRVARSEAVFVLDADNLVYPDTLRKLKAALDHSGAEFAYGMIAKFGGATGFISWLPWDLDELTRRNYIDAMALVRRSAWQAVGGFRPELGEMFGNWEDYGMWLDFAERGFRGVLVPEVVALYRTHSHSMLSVASLETVTLVDYLRRTHPTLPWPPWS